MSTSKAATTTFLTQRFVLQCAMNEPKSTLPEIYQLGSLYVDETAASTRATYATQYYRRMLLLIF